MKIEWLKRLLLSCFGRAVNPEPPPVVITVRARPPMPEDADILPPEEDEPVVPLNSSTPVVIVEREGWVVNVEVRKDGAPDLELLRLLLTEIRRDLDRRKALYYVESTRMPNRFYFCMAGVDADRRRKMMTQVCCTAARWAELREETNPGKPCNFVDVTPAAPEADSDRNSGPGLEIE